jgi:threonine dehydrogenase-like Zn-dependent dehydrogenase
LLNLTHTTNHRRYAPHLIELVRTRAVDSTAILTKAKPIKYVLYAYRLFDQRETGWTKVELKQLERPKPL